MMWINSGVKSNYALIQETHLSFAYHKLYFLAQEGCFFRVATQPHAQDQGVGVGLSLVTASGGLEIGEQFVHMCACPCGKHVCVCVRGWRAVGGCRARDARIKERLVEIKALPWSLPARLQATRVTNPSLLTLQ